MSVSNKLPLEHLATVLGCVASWEDERVLRRPEEEDRRGRGKGDAQDRSRTGLRRGYLLSQALRRHGPRGEAPRSEETPGSKPKLDEGARKLLEADLRERPAATLPQRGASSCDGSVGWRSATRRFPGCWGAWDGAEKKIGGCERARRVAEGRLEDDGRREHRSGPLRVRRRVRDEYLALRPLYAWSRRG